MWKASGDTGATLCRETVGVWGTEWYKQFRRPLSTFHPLPSQLAEGKRASKLGRVEARGFPEEVADEYGRSQAPTEFECVLWEAEWVMGEPEQRRGGRPEVMCGQGLGLRD